LVRRLSGVVASAALALVLCSGIVRAAIIPPTATPLDLGSQLMLRLFGENSDSRASFAAARGDRTSESPFRELALQVSSTEQKSSFEADPASAFASGTIAPAHADVGLSDLTAALNAGLIRPDARFGSAAQSRDDLVSLIPSNALLTAKYQPVAPAPDISPAPGTLAFTPPAAASFGPSDSAGSAHSTAFVPATMQVAGVRFQPNVEGTTSATPQLSMRDNAYGAGANFQVRAGKRDLNLNLSTQYEHVSRNDSNTFSATTLDSAAGWQLPGADAPLVIPNYADLNRFSVGAGIGVPLVRGLTLNLNYGAQRVFGGYGLPGLVNLDAVNNTYGGKLTFAVPDSSKTLSISAYQEHFSDSFLPIPGSTQTREYVNFTVKF
jgi:hypothetical protein